MDWSLENALQQAQLFVEEFGLPEQQPKLLRTGSSASFAVHSQKGQPLVLRILPPQGNWESAQKETMFASWLASQGFSCAVPVCEPATSGPAVASLWQWIEHSDMPMSFHDYGKMMQRFHGLARRYRGPLPVFDYVQSAKDRVDRISVNDMVDQASQEFLTDVGNELAIQARQLPIDHRAVIHGAFHMGNILMSSSEPVLIDFEAVQRGPVLWDVVDVAITQKFFVGGSEKQYQSFVDSYGYDATTSPHWELLTKLRLFSVLVCFGNLPATPEYIEEYQRRILFFKQKDAPLWNAV